jgi:hypothetical protein
VGYPFGVNGEESILLVSRVDIEGKWGPKEAVFGTWEPVVVVSAERVPRVGFGVDDGV